LVDYQNQSINKPNLENKMAVQLPNTPDAIKWYHHLAATPLKGLAALNLGPLGGENSISSVIEAVLAHKRGEPVTFAMSKSDRFFTQQFTKQDPPDEMIEYRELSHLAQEEILERWGETRLGVIWIGAGVFTLAHPLLAGDRQNDWHIWSDALPRVVESALHKFEALQEKQKIGKLSQNIELPQDIGQLNAAIQDLDTVVDHFVIFGYGVTYALTIEENYQWLSKLELPPSKNVSFVFNGPAEKIPFFPALMAAFHDQRMVYYNLSDIEALFQAAVPGSEVVWHKPRKETRNNMWETWLILSEADKR
jgi:hypothetical protein